MYFVALTLQALLMNWFIAKLVFHITAENTTHKAQFDEQLRLIQAEDQEEAFMKARMIGLAEEDAFYNDQHKMVKWEFINVCELIRIPRLEDGIEVYSRIHELEESKPYITFIHEKAVNLRLNFSVAHP
jgi:hypothetical protein